MVKTDVMNVTHGGQGPPLPAFSVCGTLCLLPLESFGVKSGKITFYSSPFYFILESKIYTQYAYNRSTHEISLM